MAGGWTSSPRTLTPPRAIAFSRPPSITAHPELVEGPDEATGRRERRGSTQVGWFDKRCPELGEGLTTSGTWLTAPLPPAVIYGRYEACPLPRPEWAARFLDVA